VPPSDLLPDWAVAQAFQELNRRRPALAPGDTVYAAVTREAQRLVRAKKQAADLMRLMGQRSQS
jgi:hypothetical protein